VAPAARWSRGAGGALEPWRRRDDIGGRPAAAWDGGGMPKRSAGLLLYRVDTDGPQVLLVHPGGPIWAKKDEGAWSIPKGEFEPGEDARAVAAREFTEELGSAPPPDGWLELGEITQAGGKQVTAFAAAGDLDPSAISSNTFVLEWPPRSGRRQQFPEVDRAAWFGLAEARGKLIAAQTTLLDRLVEQRVG
jgi:predicted NUDIX family NTP pyrophosphohydrolase